MKPSWQTKKLGEVCNFQNGFAFKSSEYVDSGFFVMRIGNVQDGYISLSDPKYITKSHKPFEKFVLQSGDILISLTGNVGRVGVINDEHLPSVINQRVARIVLKSKNLLQKQFLLYFLKSSKFIDELINAGHGAAQQNISTKDIENLEIPLPSLPEQYKIVEILDEVFEKLTKAKDIAGKNLQNSRELFESYLHKIFENSDNDWTEKKLGDICSKITDGKHGDCEDENNSGFYFLSAKDVKDGTLHYEKARQITKKDFEETHRRTDLKPGDVLVTNSGTIGRMAIAANDDKTYKTTFQKSVAIIKPIQKILYNFFCYYQLKADLSKLMNVSSGTAQKNLLLGDLREHLISYPPLPKQKSIVKKLDELSGQTKKLEEIYRRKLELLEELKKSVLTKAFREEL